MIAIGQAFLGRSASYGVPYCPSPNVAIDCVPYVDDNMVEFSASCNAFGSCAVYKSAATTIG